jgi:hypothetical protein
MKDDIAKWSENQAHILSGHVWYNADSCLVDALPGTYLSVSFAVLALLAFLF